MEQSEILNKFSKSTDTCFGKKYSNPLQGFFNQFRDSYFFANVLQFLLVTIMYAKVGNGKYWKVLFYASLAGFLGSLLENITVAFICIEDQKKLNNNIIILLFNEIFWFINQYSVPLLNLIKMSTLTDGKFKTKVKYIILGLSIPFLFFRFNIGYERMKKGYLVDEKINSIHGYAFGVLATSDIICSFSILYLLKKHDKEQTFKDSKISDHIKHSSYNTLMAVDIVSFILSILNIITSLKPFENSLSTSITIPFHCLMSNFILILAVDSVILKYSVKLDNVLNFSCPDNSTLKNSDFNIDSLNKSPKNSNFIIDIRNINNIDTYGKRRYTSFINSEYSNMDHNYDSVYIPTTISTSKCIIKNYLTRTVSIDSDKTY